MKILAWGAAVGAVAALVACGSGGGNTGGGGGTGGNPTTTVSSSSSSSTSSSSSSSGTPVTCGGVTWDDRADCQSCMETSCCSEMEACGAGTACDTWFQCAVACKDAACVDGCTASSQQGHDDYYAMADCYDSSCKADQACGYQVCTSGLLYTSDLQKCAECLGTSCCDPYTACMMDQGCGTCELTADPTKLPANCTDTSNTATLYSAAETCKANSCAKDCTTDICGSGLGYSLPSCNYCLTQQCCTQFDACLADATCKGCLSMPTGAGCATSTLFTGFTQCRDVTCKADCGG